MGTIKIFQALYLFLPAYVATMAAVFTKRWRIFASLDVPIDAARFGQNKTWRGIVAGGLFGMLTVAVQRLFFEEPIFWRLSLLAYDDVPFLLIGAAMGFGALFGDLVKSFVKRQLGKKPGAPFFPWDQLDQVIGSFFFLLLWYRPPAEHIAIAIILTPLLTPIVNRLAYRFGLKRVPW